MFTYGIDFADFGINLKEPGAAGKSVGFERRRYGEADSFVGARFVGDDEISGKWVEAAFVAFDGGVERFEIDGGVNFIHKISIL